MKEPGLAATDSVSAVAAEDAMTEAATGHAVTKATARNAMAEASVAAPLEDVSAAPGCEIVATAATRLSVSFVHRRDNTTKREQRLTLDITGRGRRHGDHPLPRPESRILQH
jgi:hypothetical protein